MGTRRVYTRGGLHGNVYVRFIAGNDRGTSSLEGTVNQVEPLLEKSVKEWVKAAVESSLGESGTVGVMAVESFMVKMKEVFHEVLASHSPLPVAVPPVAGAGSVVLEAGSVRGDPNVGGSVAASRVPSGFGESASTAVVEEPAAVQSSDPKPGNACKITCNVIVIKGVSSDRQC